MHGIISNTPPLNFEINKTASLPTQKSRIRYNIDRGNPYSSKNKGLSCKTDRFGLKNVITTDCHQISISGSTFQDYNPYQYRRKPLNSYKETDDSTYDIYNTYDYTASYDSSATNDDSTSKINYNIFQEGMLLGVANVNGKISLKNNVFKYF